LQWNWSQSFLNCLHEVETRVRLNNRQSPLRGRALSVVAQPEFAREPLALLVGQVGVDQVGAQRALVGMGF